MTQNIYKTQSVKYEFISGQHGGYYRHDFIDHAYLYNLAGKWFYALIGYTLVLTVIYGWLLLNKLQ